MDQRPTAKLTPFLTILALLALLVAFASLSVRSNSSRYYRDAPPAQLSLQGAGLASGGMDFLNPSGIDALTRD